MTEIIAPTHPFDSAIDLTPAEDGVFAGHTSAAFANMVGPFGGITAATLLRAVQQHPDRLGDPLSLTVNYAGPVAEGAFEITARATRTNRTTQHWSLELTQAGVLTTTATAVFGIRRETWESTESEMPRVPAPDAVEPSPFPEFIAWARNYDMRFVEGAVPNEDSGENPDSTSTLWVRPTPARSLDYPALAALADVFFPRVFLRRGRYMPAGTVSLTVYFHGNPEALATQADEPLLGTARTGRFGNGYFDQSAELWGRDGALLATSHQLVYFKD
ncbi:thioesterase family protein [Rhodococcus triatomae]|uniref:Acyl-CoA thioesterase n=1 Tax=Rhodococcus triatomae TaxID=300028 RepID=A0A1G8GHZ6_9NOCA|nr:thioesterase family protein [Rhodococcus triatomae]QNG20371.1 thioesterase family protein [Rhodococcus triatomae]QNG23713.1 thioesterase family protein [Rhodococcus triatomae]SDH94008.1 Acyl-CoA thioesterase [Rhodococcus triatomae]